MNELNVKKTTKAVERLQYIALFILALFLITGIDLVTGDLGWQQLTDPYFYISNILTDTALLCVTFATVYAYLDFFKESNAEYNEYIRNISEFARSKENIPSILSKYLDFLNRNRKIAQYKYNIRVKLFNLENKKTFLWFLRKKKTIYSEEEMHLWNYGTDEEKKKSQYCRKRKMYEEQLTEEYIQKNIDNLFVKYDKVTSEVLLSEYFKEREFGVANEFVTKNEGSQIVRYRVPKLLFSFAFTFILASLILENMAFNVAALIKIAAKLIVLVWNVYTSYRYAKKHADRITLKDARFRNSIIVEYRKWLGQQATPAPVAEPTQNM